MGTPREKSRNWIFTQYDLEFDFEALMDKKQVRYIAFSLEHCKPSEEFPEGRPHLQGWMYFHNQQGSYKLVGKMFGNANVRIMKGSLLQNDAYCSKESEGVLTTFGERPPGQGMRTDIDAEKERVVKGEVSCDDLYMENPSFMHQYGRTMSKIEDIVLRRKWRTWETEGVWYTGPTFAGKSHAAFEGFDPSTHFVKCLADEWWDGYAGQETVILNEFRGEIKFGELMAMCDKWPYTVRRRGREPVPFLARVVKVATIMSPEEMWPGQPLDEFNRRFVVHVLKKRKVDQKCSEGNTEPQSQN